MPGHYTEVNFQGQDGGGGGWGASLLHNKAQVMYV